MLVVDERSAPRGMLTITAPVAAGEDMLRALLDEFIERHPAVSIRLAAARPSRQSDRRRDQRRAAHRAPDQFHTRRDSGRHGAERRGGFA
ncbi:hypothetical protein BCEP4_430029 [Burkholderia cepacia]|nr:hypothetical protein BCEP4_430029 [Burkholderia cepacia]